MEYQEVRIKLETNQKEMNAARDRLGTAKEVFLTLKADYENEYSKCYLMAKTRNPKYTVQDVKAETVNLCHDKKIALIKAECAFELCVDKLRVLQKEYEILMEESRFARKEIERFGDNYNADTEKKS